ncbi:hypothetical protein [Fischerella sp. PCC 9605]|uniref:hypothetical protein n=1 Tax=Fischerella sp. PCC 9605 TaxID=1173024 RepID=UPI0004B57DBA|nr:hypothetical protein [Fischerella sp. PCC 9605]
MLGRTFNVHRDAVKQFLHTYDRDIQQYHDSQGVTNLRGHNRQAGRNVHQLKAFVQKHLQNLS